MGINVPIYVNDNTYELSLHQTNLAMVPVRFLAS